MKIRPGFTPQEDVSRFRGTKQAQMDANTLPKGHIIGWAPPPTSSAGKSEASSKPLSKSAKKNAKRREKKDDKQSEAIKDSWEDDGDEADGAAAPPPKKATNAGKGEPGSKGVEGNAHTPDKPSRAAVPEPDPPASPASKSKNAPASDATKLASKLEKLAV